MSCNTDGLEIHLSQFWSGARNVTMCDILEKKECSWDFLKLYGAIILIVWSGLALGYSRLILIMIFNIPVKFHRFEVFYWLNIQTA